MPDTCIYLDHHATTPLDERVFNIMKPFFLCDFGNPASSTHPYGWRALEAVNHARKALAQAIHAHPTEIIFTSGATESSNMAIKGLFTRAVSSKYEIITSSIEHPATLNSVRSLESEYIHGVFIKPNSDGVISPSYIEKSLSRNTILVSVFLVNNEIGSINDIKSIAEITKKHGVLLHCDAAQALGRVPIDCEELGIDMLSLSGHKFYGPKGVGALYVKKHAQEKLHPLFHGGGHEWGMRSGTLNVPGIVGMGEAARIAVDNLEKEVSKISSLRDRLWNNLKALPDIFLNGSLQRVAGNLNCSFKGIDGEELVLALCHRVAVSTGSACSLGHTSRVLEEIGIAPELRQAAIRFGIGRSNTQEEIDEVSELIVQEVKRLRHKNKKKLVKLVRG